MIAILSLYFAAGNAGVGRAGRRLSEVRSTIAQRRKLPKSSTSAALPFASRCASAQHMTATSIGCRAMRRSSPGR